MDNKTMIPVCCNHFGVTTNNGLTFTLDFRYQEPSSGKEKVEITTFSRVAIDRIGIERLMVLLQKTLAETKGSANSSPNTFSGKGTA